MPDPNSHSSEFTSDCLLYPHPEGIPEELRSLPHWLAWEAFKVCDGDQIKRINKVPVSATTGGHADATSLKSCAPLQTVCNFLNSRKPQTLRKTDLPIAGKGRGALAGLGLALFDNIPLGDGLVLFAIDIDHALDANGNVKEKFADIVCRLCACTYVEISPSGEGLRAFLAVMPTILTQNRGEGVEVYCKYRFVTVTGRRLASCSHDDIGRGAEAERVFTDLCQMMNSVRTKSVPSNPAVPRVYDSKRPSCVLPPSFVSDEIILTTARKAKNRGAKFKKLYDDGDVRDYPTPSEARYALIGLLAFYCGPDHARIDRLMRGSALSLEKWDRLGEGEIAKILTTKTDFYNWNHESRKTKTDKSVFEDLEYSEDDLALSFIERHGHDLRYDHIRELWYVWNGVRWEVDCDGYAANLLRDHCRELSSVLASKSRKALMRSLTLRGVESMSKTDRRVAVTSKIWDAKKFLLGTPRGTVNLREGAVFTSRREDYITKSTSVPPAYELPMRWLHFLDEACGHDQGLIDFLQEVFGMGLTGDTSEQKFFFCYGTGGNGKSVFLEVIEEILGDYCVHTNSEVFTYSKMDRHPEELARLAGARLVTVSETEAGRSWAESRIKSMTGGDRITARFMHENSFEYVPQFKLFIVGNHKPILHNPDEAMRRRLRMIPFTHKPERPDPNLKEKLREEYPAILGWMIAGCLRWQQEGLSCPPCVAAETDAYFADQDLFQQWIDESCKVGDELSVRSADLFTNWIEFADKHGLPKSAIGSTRTFSEKLHSLGFGKERLNKGVVYHGIAVKGLADG